MSISIRINLLYVFVIIVGMVGVILGIFLAFQQLITSIYPANLGHPLTITWINPRKVTTILDGVSLPAGTRLRIVSRNDNLLISLASLALPDGRELLPPPGFYASTDFLHLGWIGSLVPAWSKLSELSAEGLQCSAAPLDAFGYSLGMLDIAVELRFISSGLDNSQEVVLLLPLSDHSPVRMINYAANVKQTGSGTNTASRMFRCRGEIEKIAGSMLRELWINGLQEK